MEERLRKQWQEGTGYKPGGGSSPDTESAGTLTLDNPASRQKAINFCCLSHPVCGVFFFFKYSSLNENSIQSTLHKVWSQADLQKR